MFPFFDPQKQAKEASEERKRMQDAERARREELKKYRARMRALYPKFRAEEAVIDLERGEDGVYRPASQTPKEPA